MKYLFRNVLTVIMVLTLLCITAHASEYDDSGYSKATIYIQNKLDEYYHDHFETAIGYWDGYDDEGNKHLPGRSIVVNTESYSQITNVSFRFHPEFGVLNSQFTYGLYVVEYPTSLACDCHTTAGFTIYINDYFAREATDEYLRTSNENLATIVHEMGHAYGLIDFDESYYVYDSIMSYRVNNNTMYQPQERDYRNARASWARHE